VFGGSLKDGVNIRWGSDSLRDSLNIRGEEAVFGNDPKLL
jgi:hypothetical protein